MKILALNASPRLNGNCRVAIEKIQEYTEQKGADVEIIDLNLSNIDSCQSCNFCKTHAGLCMINDDMQEIRKKISGSDAIILAAPIYFSQLNAQATTFINRLYAFFQTEMVHQEGESYVVTVKNIYDYDIENSEQLKRIKAGIIITQGLKDVNEYENYLNSGIFDQINLLFNMQDVIVLEDSNIPGIIKDKPEQLEKIIEFADRLI